MVSVWDAKDAELFIQPGGPGNNWQYTDRETEVEAIAGGDVSFESDYAGGEYIGSRVTSNPGDFTGTVLSRRYNTASALRELANSNCYFGMLLASGCPELRTTQFNGAIGLFDAAFTTRLNTSAKMLDRMEGANAKVNDSLPFRAPVLQEWRPLNHDRVGITTNADINHVIGIGNKRCAGPCGTRNNGSQEYVAVGGAVSPATIPRVHYTDDGGLTWKSLTLTGITNGTAVRVTRSGDRILIAVTGTSAGLWAISYNTLKDPATTTSITATLVGGISSGTAVNDVLAVGNLIFAVGNTGTIWVSLDKGYSFSVLNNTATAANLTRIAARNENLVYFGGVGGVLVVYTNQTSVTLVSPSVITGDDVTALAIPKRWTDELYIGTSTGEMWRTRDGRVSYEQVRWNADMVGAVTYIGFVGDMGSIMVVAQNDATPNGRILIDRSGGAGGDDMQVIGSYTSPANGGFNAVAMTDVNYGIVVGAINNATGYIGRIHG